MAIAHNLGFPRIGARRELKRLVEDYWAERINLERLEEGGRVLRRHHWKLQLQAGMFRLPVGDFSWYDQVLDHSLMFGVIPRRFGDVSPDLVTLFRMARGRAPGTPDARACEMTKWFDTNYHYLVPEFEPGVEFRLSPERLYAELEEARAVSNDLKVVLIGPLTYLWLGKAVDPEFDRLRFLPRLLELYQELLRGLAARGVHWVQMDEPALVTELPQDWWSAGQNAYQALAGQGVRLLLATYFGGLGERLQDVLELPVDGWHLDRVRGADMMEPVHAALGPEKVVSMGVIDGRNIWRADLQTLSVSLRGCAEQLKDRLWLAPSCSLLHVPVDLGLEKELPDELRSWMAFAVQKLRELRVLAAVLPGGTRVLSGGGREAAAAEITTSAAVAAARHTADFSQDTEVREQCSMVQESMARRTSTYAKRSQLQRARLGLPALPTTTIGSFPQTPEIRRARSARKSGMLSKESYREGMQEHIRRAIEEQERLGLDVLVHGEAERNDMVEYFGELLQGFAITQAGWVQSYGSRCVKPPIIHGDVSRPRPMTVEWIRYAQEQTSKPVKGMLTGPLTILSWSFPRADLKRSEICTQIALALRKEVQDLEEAGVRIIQIDEPAFREGLPLRRSQWPAYLEWATRCFRLASSGVADETQIHTHMCYSEFNDIIEALVDLDADVITIETARSNMELLEAFSRFQYPNELGPGVYDIHAPLVPEEEHMMSLLRKAAEHISAERLWVNPDCGLKTRAWRETRAALHNMVRAAHRLRAELGLT